MDPDSEDIEEKCNNAVFEVCNARERYPKQCADELGNYLRIKNSIAMKAVVLKPSAQNFEIPELLDIEERGTSNKDIGTPHAWDNDAKRLQKMVDKVQELKLVIKQLEDNRHYK